MTTRPDLNRCVRCFEATDGSAPDRRLCAACEAMPAEGECTPDLSPGIELGNGRYVTGKVLGRGPFGLTYLGWDPRLQRRVALKEFLPVDVAGRSADGRTVQVHSRGQESVLEYARERFRQEARLVSHLDHPNIIRVLDFFPDNGTEYMVMDYLPGETLLAYMNRNGRIPESSAAGLTFIVLDALEEVHRERDGEHHIHRDLKPTNIYLASVGDTVVPKLIDFGAARTAVGEKTRNLTQVLTPGYAPFEQYHSKGVLGPWTDVYACAATLYHMLTGQKPTAAPDRYENDSLEPPRALVPELSATISEGVMEGLILDRKQRPQSAAAFRRVLSGEDMITVERPFDDETEPADRESGDTTKPKGMLRRFADVFGRKPAR